MNRISDIPVFLINLDRSVDRLADATEMLTNVGLSFTRVAAVDGSKCDLDQVVDYDDARVQYHVGRSLNSGEYGCYKSHLVAAQHIVDSGHDFGLVFEDDVIVSDDFRETLMAAISALKVQDKRWDLINIGGIREKYSTDLADLPNARRLVVAHYFPMTTSCLLWSREGALAFVRDHSVVTMPVDALLRWSFARKTTGFAIWPAMVSQRMAPSDIDGTIDGSARYKHRKLKNAQLMKLRLNARNGFFALMNRTKFRLKRRLTSIRRNQP
ncbi:MAG: glycosyltransferase family 25 protein [Planktomarina sp.]